MRSKHLLAGLVVLALASGGARAETKKEYFAILMAGKKIGHAEYTRSVADGKVTTVQTQVMTITRSAVPLTIRQVETHVETVAGKPLAFKAVQDLGIMAQTIDGTVDKAGKVRIKTTSGENVVERTMDWPEGALLSEGFRLLGLKKGLRQGTKYAAKTFIASLLMAAEMEAEVGAKRNVDLLGRVVELTEIKVLVKAPTGVLNILTYVDKEYKELKTVTSILGMKMEFIACSRHAALSKNDVLDFFDKLILTSPTPLKGLREARSATYHLAPTGDGRLTIPATDNQKVRRVEGTVIVTVRPVAAPRNVTFPYKGKDKIALEALKPTRFLQSDDKKVAALARKAVGKTTDAAEAVRRIEAFVARYIRKKDLSIGYASASEVAASRQGDCTEHAVLAAAMCRAVGIPAQVVSGVVHIERMGDRKHVFGPHAWGQALIGGKWIGFDPAMKHIGAGHIALLVGNGDLDEFFGILSTLGQFKITKAEVAKQGPGTRPAQSRIGR